MYISEIISKPILSLYEGELLGNIRKIHFDKTHKKIKSFEILNDQDICYNLSPKHIYTVGKNAITIKNKQNLILSLNEDSPQNQVLPLNVKVYSLQGEYLGLAVDYSFDEKYTLSSIILDNQQLISINDIASCSTNSIVTYTNNQQVNIKSFRYRISNKTSNQSKVKVMPKLFASFNKIASSASRKNDFIVGRICTKDIVDNNNNIIVKQNSTITEQTLAQASSKNKLQELMKYSRTK